MSDLINERQELAKYSPKVENGSGDSIYRQAAIDAIKKSRFLVDAMEKVIKLPSAQPEKETCKDCKWEYAFGYGECHHCRRHFNDMWEMNDNG